LEVEAHLGPRQRLGQVQVTGVPPEEAANLLELAGLKEGEPARRPLLAAASLRLVDWFRARGFPRVKVTPQLQPDPQDPNLLQVTLAVDPGPAFRLGTLRVAGPHRLGEALALRLSGLVPGQPLDLQQVQGGKRNLWATGLFRYVRAEVKEEGELAQVTYHLWEEPSISLSYGLRWESSQGAAGLLEYVDRNLAGRLLTLGLRGLYEKNRQSLRLFLGVPATLLAGTSGQLFLEGRRLTTPGNGLVPTLVEDSRRLTLQATRKVAPSWQLQLYGRYQQTHIYERTDFFPLDITLTFPYLGLGLTHDSRDDPVLAHKGWLVSLDLSGTGRAFNADFTFLRLFGQLATYRPLDLGGNWPLTWAQSLRLGLAMTPAGQELIRSERFFAGGEYSVRGYGQDSLGPQEDLGFLRRPLGGKALLVINQELRLQLPWDLTGVLFLDAGQIWAKPAQVRLGDLALASGLGLRARTPLGTFRLDLAFPWQRGNGHNATKLYLGFGSIF
jgi:outer membrane protein assembly factor BamA